ncbi:hypothetical protein OPQ81_008803 [Rhizoctonia solani]|nr:hypothetical protein OPQ81_008803 [Rhizoctonia solani]
MFLIKSYPTTARSGGGGSSGDDQPTPIFQKSTPEWCKWLQYNLGFRQNRGAKPGISTLPRYIGQSGHNVCPGD